MDGRAPDRGDTPKLRSYEVYFQADLSTVVRGRSLGTLYATANLLTDYFVFSDVHTVVHVTLITY